MHISTSLRNSFLGLLSLGFLTSCGQDTTRTSDLDVISGWKVDRTVEERPTFESTVAVTTRSLLQQGKPFCSGTLIRPQVVMTAAHCLVDDSGKLSRKASEILVAFDLELSSGSTTRSVRRVSAHPYYDAKNAGAAEPTGPAHDVGLLFLSSNAPSSHKPISIYKGQLSTSDAVWVAGFGSSATLFGDGSGTLRAASLDISNINSSLRRIETSNLFRGSCSGDSGGPLYLRKGGRWYVTGVVSAGSLFGPVCSGQGSYLDARGYFNSWIKDQLRAYQ